MNCFDCAYSGRKDGARYRCFKLREGIPPKRPQHAEKYSPSTTGPRRIPVSSSPPGRNEGEKRSRGQ